MPDATAGSRLSTSDVAVRRRFLTCHHSAIHVHNDASWLTLLAVFMSVAPPRQQHMVNPEASTLKLGERCAVAQHDAARRWQLDGCGSGQLGQRARDGLDGEAEIV